MATAVTAPHPSGAACALLDDGRWHFQHGPIDLIIGATGQPAALEAAVSGAWRRFVQLLPELAAQLPLLRSQAEPGLSLSGPVACRMLGACLPYARQTFVTTMAAVAGSVADELITFFSGQPGVQRAYINNGGDIALHLGAGQSFRVGLFSDLGRYQGDTVDLDGAFSISADMPVRGIATSGWRGRSFSMGIADSVTILAETAAHADVAATMVANQVFVNHQAVRQAPADSLKDDTDLGPRLVTVEVGTLPGYAIDQALDNGLVLAQRLCREETIYGAVLMLQGSVRIAGMDAVAGSVLGEQQSARSTAIQGLTGPLDKQQTKESHV